MQNFTRLPIPRVNYEPAADQPYPRPRMKPHNHRNVRAEYPQAALCRSFPSCYLQLETRSARSSLPSQGITSSRLRNRFDELVLRWKMDTEVMSSSSQVLSNESFRRIVGLGNQVLPFILAELQRSGDPEWIEALSEIAGFHFWSRDSSENDLIDKWLHWGRERDLVG